MSKEIGIAREMLERDGPNLLGPLAAYQASVDAYVTKAINQELDLGSDPARHPFVRQVAAQLPDHGDREQLVAGIDLILAGIQSGT